MQDNLFQWVKQDKPVGRVVHHCEVIFKILNSTMYIFRLVIEQLVGYVYPSCKRWTTLNSMQGNLLRVVKQDKSISRVVHPSEVN